MGSTLTDMVLAYQKTGEGREEIEEIVARKLYWYPQKRYGWSEDDSSDFFLSFYEKLPALLERYRDRGYSFEAYLFCTFKWQMKTFLVRKRRNGAHERVLDLQEYRDAEAESVPHGEAVVSEGIFSYRGSPWTVSRAVKKRFLYFVLTEALTLGDEHLERVAAVTEIPTPTLQTYVDALRSRMTERLTRLTTLREKRNGAYFRCKVLEDELRNNTADPEMCEKIRKRISQETQRIKSIQEEISCIPLCPTHRDIAEVLGIPKGTVDSGIYYLKKMAKDLYPDTDIRYA